MSDLITKDMPIAEVVQRYPASVPVFLRHGLFCFGCAVAQFENLEQGAVAHGIDPVALLADLNEVAAQDGQEATEQAEK
ncbi:MAG: DUF1858 domain-containing protein [Dehalococcoidales bacterium]|nr:DUF1858 domain-containing protein [Dehalococcoidales bacterium]